MSKQQPFPQGTFPSSPAPQIRRQEQPLANNRQVTQPKMATGLQMRKPPVAPPVYRPQPAPHVLQRKVATNQQVVRPQNNAPAAPAVYRPQPVPKVLQTKTAAPHHPQKKQAGHQPMAPAVYRPQAIPRCLQPKATANRQLPAGAVNSPPTSAYRPQPIPKVLQTKKALAERVASPQTGAKATVAPPVYRTNQMQQVLQRKHSGVLQPAAPTNQTPTGSRQQAFRGLPRQPVIQRMIVAMNNGSNDYATIKVIYQITKYENDPDMTKGARLYTMGNIPATGTAGSLGQHENVYIVGHGRPGEVWSGGRNSGAISMSDLAGELYDSMPDNWDGEIKVLTCRSAVTKDDDDKTVTSAVSSLKKELGDYNLNAKVVGTTGFSYGTPQTGKSGLTSVLKSGFANFYKGDYESGMENAIPLPDEGERVPDTVRRRQMSNAVGKTVGKKFISPSSSTELVKGWVQVRDAIETDLQTEVATASNNGGKTIAATVKTLASTKKWGELLTEQEQEFTFYNMFADTEDAFVKAK